MQCDDIRAQLSSIRPDSGDADHEDFASAMAHLEQCADCQAYWELQQQTDRDLARAIRNVAVPPDFKSRLLAQLTAAIDAPAAASAATETVTAEIALPTTTVQPQSRMRPADRAWTRRRAATVVSAALLMLAFCGLFFLNRPRQVRVSVEELVALAQTPGSSSTGQLQESVISLPGGEIDFATLQHGAGKTQIVQYQGQDIGILIPYEVRLRGNTFRSVVLMVVNLDPRRIVVSNLSTVGTSFVAARVDYPAPNMYATRVWQAGGQLYICYVNSRNADDLERLRMRKHIT